MYMLRTSEHKSTSRSTKKYQITLDSGATTHVMNASSLDGGVEVMHAPSTIKTAHLGDTMTSNLIANVGILKDVIIMDDSNLDMNLASVARFDKAGYRVVFERGMGVVYDADGNTLLEATLTDDLYIFDMRDAMQYQKAMLASSAPKEDLNLWHRRLGHRNKRDILTAVIKDLITGT